MICFRWPRSLMSRATRWKTCLRIITSSMLVIAVGFAAGSMLDRLLLGRLPAATPRAFTPGWSLTTFQYALSATSSGASSFGIDGLIALMNGLLLARSGRFGLISNHRNGVQPIVVLSLRQPGFDRIARLGRVTNTIDRGLKKRDPVSLMEHGKVATLRAFAQPPTMHFKQPRFLVGLGDTAPRQVGYLQRINLAELAARQIRNHSIWR